MAIAAFNSERLLSARLWYVEIVFTYVRNKKIQNQWSESSLYQVKKIINLGQGKARK